MRKLYPYFIYFDFAYLLEKTLEAFVTGVKRCEDLPVGVNM